MRIVTRPDFDGIVCAVLLSEAFQIETNVTWTEPNEVQTGKFDIQKGDILANLPYAEGCELWFDHHVSNKPDISVAGAFEIAPSAAGVVYRYCQKKGLLDDRYDELVEQTDIIDGALLDQDQVRFPEKYPYVLLSMTIKNKNYEDMAYWDRLVGLLTSQDISEVLEDEDVKIRCRQVVRENREYEAYLKKYTRVENQISITDFRGLDPVPDGNRFMTYSLYPDSMSSIKIRFAGTSQEKVAVSVGHSIFNRTSRVNIGYLLAKFGGGGHAGAGGCTLEAKEADAILKQICIILSENKEISPPGI